eukprot:12899092-Prorocentrum_lima.AAC.1
MQSHVQHGAEMSGQHPFMRNRFYGNAAVLNELEQLASGSPMAELPNLQDVVANLRCLPTVERVHRGDHNL